MVLHSGIWSLVSGSCKGTKDFDLGQDFNGSPTLHWLKTYKFDPNHPQALDIEHTKTRKRQKLTKTFNYRILRPLPGVGWGSSESVEDREDILDHALHLCVLTQSTCLTHNTQNMPKT